MTITEMLGQSAILTLLGMAVVFSFLIILVIFISLTAKIIKVLKLDQDKQPQNGVVQQENKSAIVAAIATALKQKNIQ